mmetsp:Transcript_43590/g.103590  ORF Transcript_43590/g.103590 Transcript_43590/m.103590 type:complete len:239 (+) Transcript_43590:340-1056(+)
MSSMSFCSYALTVPYPCTVSTPSLPRVTGDEKNFASVTVDSTNEHSVTPFSPLRARRTEPAISAPAYAIESVADPPPAFAFTTSSPPNMMRWVSASRSESSNFIVGSTWERSGTMVVPAWPPMTVTFTLFTSRPLACDTKVRARTTSRVVTPSSLRGSYTPCFLRTAEAMGTVELTGFEMIRSIAFGQFLAQASMRVATMDALVLKRSSRVMPGLRGTPAGITTSWQSLTALPRSSPV